MKKIEDTNVNVTITLSAIHFHYLEQLVTVKQFKYTNKAPFRGTSIL